MTRKRRPSPQTRSILAVLAEDRGRWWHGYDLVRRTGIASGTLYPILMRLADRGFLEAKWEQPQGGRPPRHLYRMTPAGTELAASVSTRPRTASRLDPLTGPA